MNNACDRSWALRSSLAAGDIVVLYCRSGPTIGEARDASRQAAAWLQGTAAFSSGRIGRSATPGLGVVAAHREFALGVDAEAVNSCHVSDDMSPLLLHPDERPLFRVPISADALTALWVRKEAVLKAFGVGLAVEPTTLCTGGYDERWRPVTHGVLGAAMVRSLEGPEGFALGVALLGTRSAPVCSVDYEFYRVASRAGGALPLVPFGARPRPGIAR